MEQLHVDHLPELVRLTQAWEELSPEVGGISWSESNLSTSLADNNIWGVISEGNVVAFVVLRESAHAIEVDYLATDIHHQRKGYMSIIFKYLKYQAKNSAKPIWLEVSKNNLRATQFYEKFGFIKGGARKNYYKNGQEALIYSYNP